MVTTATLAAVADEATTPAPDPAATAAPGPTAGSGSAVVDLLGALAYGELTAYLRLSQDAETAPTLPYTAALGRMAVAEFGHFEKLRERLVQMGADPEAAMAPFVAAVDAFHARTTPSDWWEGLVKAYVGDGIATDFYREVAASLDTSTRDLVHDVLADTGHADFAVTVIREAIEAEPRIGGRLALWGRRLVGEALSQAVQVVTERHQLATVLAGDAGADGADLAEVGRMFARLTDAHTRRMYRLGLTA